MRKEIINLIRPCDQGGGGIIRKILGSATPFHFQSGTTHGRGVHENANFPRFLVGIGPRHTDPYDHLDFPIP